MLHVLQPADNLHVLPAGENRVARLIERLQTAAAKPVDRGPASGAGQPRQERDDPCNVEPLFPLLLGIAEHHVFDFRGIDPGPLD